MWHVQGALLVLFASLQLTRSASFGEMCLHNFTTGMSYFVLDLDDSVKNGAIYLSNPSLMSGRDCITACCKSLGCNLVLVERNHEGEDGIKNCFLLNCVYQQEFVCKFARKDGLQSYVTLDVYNQFLSQSEHQLGDDNPPIARVNRDVKVQPFQTVMLSGIESFDNEGIIDYEWKLLEGGDYVVMQKVSEDEPYSLEVSNLEIGRYIIELIVTDTANQQSSATVTITVLSKEETEEYCFAPLKVGRCRAKFPRWWYNAESKECQEFTFGGCKPNKNNYVKKEDCIQTCRSVADTSSKSGRRAHPVCDGHCLPTQFQCADGCCIDALLECDETPDCNDQSDEAPCDNYDKGFNELLNYDDPNSRARCVELPDTGACRASFTRWYYDPESEACMSFTYGGCGGNDNNFKSKNDCLHFCKGISEKDIFGTTREDSEAREAGSGPAGVAIAVFLGICILVVLAVIGYCCLKRKKGSRRRQQNVNNNAVSAPEDTEHLVYNRTTKPV
ncbi:kunitz-type protease inhibitor 1 [Pelodytes ibericus]